MKLNRFFSIILCAALFSSNIGFAAEGWRSYVPTWEGAKTAASRAWENRPSMPDVRGKLTQAYDAMPDVRGSVRGRANEM